MRLSRKFYNKHEVLIGAKLLNVHFITILDDTLFNLKWEQYSDKAIYQRLDFSRYKQLINHF
jgi:hypothetical protein